MVDARALGRSQEMRLRLRGEQAGGMSQNSDGDRNVPVGVNVDRRHGAHHHHSALQTKAQF
jgi:hypothetical protein